MSTFVSSLDDSSFEYLVYPTAVQEVAAIASTPTRPKNRVMLTV